MSDDLPSAVLFACNLNAIRSPMAAGLLSQRARGRIYAASCGVWPGAERDPFVIEVMREKGIDLSEHEPKMLHELADASFDLIIAFTDESRAHAEEVARTRAMEVEFWPVEDPRGGDGPRDARLQAYRDVRDAIDALIQKRFFPRSTTEG